MKKITPKHYATYLSMIEGSVNSRAYLHQWALIGKTMTDIADNGGVSCAFFVSFILSGFGYITGIHSTVSGLVRKLESSGFKKVRIPKKGAIIVWETKQQPSGPHAHIGFWLSPEIAISNHPTQGLPKAHHPTFGVDKFGEPKRKIIGYYFKKGLEKT